MQQEVNAANQLASSLQTDLDIHTAALSDSKSQFEIISAQLDATRLQLLSKLTSLEADLSASKLSAEKKSKDMQTELEKQEKLHKEEMSKVKELQDKVDALEAKLEVAKEDYERLEIQSSASVKEVS